MSAFLRFEIVRSVAMLDLLAEREPQVTRILAKSADGNEHMIAINTELGFEELDREPSWELLVADAPTLANLAGTDWRTAPGRPRLREPGPSGHIIEATLLT